MLKSKEEVVEKEACLNIESSVLEFTFPMPPTVNSIWKASKYRRYRTQRYMNWIEDCSTIIKMGMKKSDVKGFDFTHLKVRMKLYFHYVKKAKRYDVDNRVKAPLDFLSQYFGFDDREVFDLHVQKYDVNARGEDYCVIHLESGDR